MAPDLAADDLFALGQLLHVVGEDRLGSGRVDAVLFLVYEVRHDFQTL